MITQRQLQKLVDKWGEPNYRPQFRFATCASCGRKLYFGMWHVFLKAFGNKREVHLCKRCGKQYHLEKERNREHQAGHIKMVRKYEELWKKYKL